MSFLIGFLTQAFEWIYNFFSGLPLVIYKACLEGLGAVIAAIPAPAFFSNASAYISGIPPLLGYFLSGLEIPAGMAIILAALVLRFVIRRIPFIG